MILGIDEVGRGPWAGPLVVGAVSLNGSVVEGLADSKKLSKAKREKLYEEIMNSNASIGIGWVHADEIDRIGLSKSLVAATKRAVKQISTPYHEIIIDGTVNFLKDTTKGAYVTTLKKADALIPAVSAASIVAKVVRDAFMETQAAIYPGYGFEAHVGYGTARHRQAIDTYGITPLHRRSFGPLASPTLSKNTSTLTLFNTTTVGLRSESEVARYLTVKGFEVIEQNWKTKLCEIDIIARKDGTYYFVEVKHRTTDKSGDGLAAITDKKLRRMKFAASVYAHFYQLDAPLRLVAVATSKDLSQVDSYIEIE